MDCMGITQRVREFDNAHGAFLCVDEWLLFEDGAMRERNPIGRLINPPKDPRQRAKNIVRFCQEKLDLSIEQFDNYKFNHQIHAKAALKEKVAPAPIDAPASVIKKLRQLQAKVKTCRQQLKKAEVELEKLKPQRLKDLEEMSNRNRESHQRLLDEIDNIEI